MRCRHCNLYRAAGIALALLALPPQAAVPADQSKFDPITGFRVARYRAPVPDSVPGGERVWVDEVERLVAEKSVILLDVMASTGPGPDQKSGAWRMVKPREHIPGSVWLPDVGKGKLDTRLLTYFKDNLERLTNGDNSRPILIYCQADCWMSWNAVKRAAGFGYTNLYWYPDGTDGWKEWDGPLVPALPIPLRPSNTDSVEER